MALVEKASVAVLRRDLSLAEKLLDQALEIASDTTERANCLQTMARVQVGRGDLERARTLLSEARALFAEAGDDFGQAECWRDMAPHEEPRRGISLLERAMDVYSRLGIRSGIAHCHNSIAEIHRLAGDHREAEVGFRRAIALFDALGGRDGNGVLPRMNLGLVYLERGDLDDAKDLFEEARAALARKGHAPLLASCNIALMATAGAREDWKAWDRCYGAARTLLRRSRYRHIDLARTALMAGHKAMELGEFVRASEAWCVAREQFEGVGDEDGLQEVEALIAALQT